MWNSFVFWKICKILSIAMACPYLCVCVCVSVKIDCIGHTLAKITNVEMMFVDFNICLRMASLRKPYYVTLTYVLKVKYLNWDFRIVASNHSGATWASKDSNQEFPIVACNYSGATCVKIRIYPFPKWWMPILVQSANNY